MISVEALEHTKRLEEQIIAALVFDPGCFEKVEDILDPRFFYHENHRRLVERIISKIKTDVNSVNAPQLAYDFVECNVSIEIISQVLTTAYIRSHCEELRNLYIWRQIQGVAGEILQKGLIRDQQELAEAISHFHGKMAEIEESVLANRSNTKTMMEAAMELIDFLDDNTPDRTLRSGLHDLDILTGGFKPGELIIIGARPGMGKTSVSLAFLDTFGQKGKRTLYFSLEMTRLDMMKRMAAIKGHVSVHRMNMRDQNGKRVLTEEEYQRISQAMAIVSNYPVIWHDRACTVGEMRLLAKQEMRRNGLDCIVVDHLGKVRPNNPRASKYEQISQIACDLKDLAKELDIPVIVLSQLSRACESRNNKRPVISDLRESGEIEQEADLVMFLYREEYYDEFTDLDGCLEILVEKHRNGPTGRVLVGFLKEYAKVVNLTPDAKKHYLEILKNMD